MNRFGSRLNFRGQILRVSGP